MKILNLFFIKLQSSIVATSFCALFPSALNKESSFGSKIQSMLFRGTYVIYVMLFIIIYVNLLYMLRYLESFTVVCYICYVIQNH